MYTYKESSNTGWSYRDDGTILYSSTFEFDEKTGKFKLTGTINSAGLRIRGDEDDYYDTIMGPAYFSYYEQTSNISTLYYVKAATACSFYWNDSAQTTETSAYQLYVNGSYQSEEWVFDQYVTSTNRSAYPDNGTSGNYKYEFVN